MACGHLTGAEPPLRRLGAAIADAPSARGSCAASLRVRGLRPRGVGLRPTLADAFRHRVCHSTHASRCAGMKGHLWSPMCQQERTLMAADRDPHCHPISPNYSPFTNNEIDRHSNKQHTYSRRPTSQNLLESSILTSSQRISFLNKTSPRAQHLKQTTQHILFGCFGCVRKFRSNKFATNSLSQLNIPKSSTSETNIATQSFLVVLVVLESFVLTSSQRISFLNKTSPRTQQKKSKWLARRGAEPRAAREAR